MSMAKFREVNVNISDHEFLYILDVKKKEQLCPWK